MVSVAIEGDELVAHLSPLERLGSLHGDVHLPLAAVREVRVSGAPWSELRGVRAPGTGIPGVIALCTRRGGGHTDFAALYGKRPALVVEATGASFDRLVLSCSDPESTRREVQAALDQGASRG